MSDSRPTKRVRTGSKEKRGARKKNGESDGVPAKQVEGENNVAQLEGDQGKLYLSTPLIS